MAMRTTADIGRQLMGMASQLVEDGESVQTIKRRLRALIDAIPDSLPQGPSHYGSGYSRGPELPMHTPDPW